MASDDERNEIEAKFAASWDRVERFFEVQSVREWLKAVPGLITTLRQRGYDRQLRAGTALWVLILSRSRIHGLRKDQTRLGIWWDDGGMVIDYYEPPDAKFQFVVPRVEITAEVEEILDRLLAKPID